MITGPPPKFHGTRDILLASVNGGYIYSTTRTLSLVGLTTGSTSVPAGSLILSTRAPIGYVAETTSETAFNQGCRGLVPVAPLDTRFHRYQLSSLAGRLAAQGLGSTFMELSTESLASTEITAPPVATQRVIADFLDAETTRIDALIAKKLRLIELGELRIAVDAATRTGAEGARVPLRRIVSRIKTGATPSGMESDDMRSEDNTVEWLSPADFGKTLTVAPSLRRLSNDAISGGAVPKFPAGSVLVVGIGATAGRVGHLDRDASGNQQVTCIIPTEGIDRRFLAWQLFSRSSEMKETAPYTTLPILNNDFLRSFFVMVTSLRDQQNVARKLDVEAERMRRASGALNRQIELLREHRQALITAAVTGEAKIPRMASAYAADSYRT